MTDPARLLEAHDHLIAALEIVDEIAPDLPEPERSAVLGVLGLRHDLARIVRALDNVATTTTTTTSLA